ncbi:MAG: type VI secretion system ATPase TssH, partial [Phycisphaerae bacterium]|nr:type VI secretion system ATPase TssH [Phycisphaerae bacterium]
KPALVARMTVIPFLTLGDPVLQMIARIKLGKVGKRLAAAHKMKFNIDEAVFAHVAGQCQQVDLGARQIDHLIDQRVLPILSRRLLEEMAGEKMPTATNMGLGEDGEFTYEFVGG